MTYPFSHGKRSLELITIAEPSRRSKPVVLNRITWKSSLTARIAGLPLPNPGGATSVETRTRRAREVYANDSSLDSTFQDCIGPTLNPTSHLTTAVTYSIPMFMIIAYIASSVACSTESLICGWIATNFIGFLAMPVKA